MYFLLQYEKKTVNLITASLIWALFSCNVAKEQDPVFMDNLTKAIYQYQLQRGGDITLNLDYATSGVGCTARGIFNQYRVLPESYQRTIIIRPLR